MLKKTITYEDYNGETRSEDFYFNLNKLEISKLEMSTPGGIQHMLEKLSQTRDYKGVMEFVENIVKLSYGVKSDDGRNFKKSPEITKDFMETEAYSELLMSFLSDGENKLAAFIEGILPQKLVAQIKLEQAKKEKEEEENKKIAAVEGTAEEVSG